MTLKLDKLSPRLLLVNPDGTPSGAFITYWQRFTEQLETADANVTNTLANLSNQLSGMTAAQATANRALDEALNPSSGGKSGTTTASTTVNNTWVHGPVVSLTGVTAGALTLAATISESTGSLSGGITYDSYGSTYATGKFRVQEVIGASETTVYPLAGNATFSIYEQVIPNTAVVIYLVNDMVNDMASFSSTLATTGAIDYRLDLTLTTVGASATIVDQSLYVRRA